MIYFEIKQMLRDKFSVSQISRELDVSRTTVYFYKAMNEEAFLAWIAKIHQKTHKLSAYETAIQGRLEKYPDLSSYQIHDWLLEHYPNVEVSRRTVSNFVTYLRSKYNLPKPPKTPKSRRDYSLVEELDYGFQAQMDFGVYKMKRSDGSRVKVYFMVMVLSRSRFKHVFFRSAPFTTQAVVEAHEEAFAYLGGIPQQMVYDQDKLMVVSENQGDILFTFIFQAYIQQRKFDIYLCRKSDPETKGKIENVVRYVKSSFLKNRLYINDEVLNRQGLAWLARTGNGQVHGTTKKVPAQEWQIEREHLQAFKPLNIGELMRPVYTVRKDNSIAYKGNFYSLPQGTYQGRNTKVGVEIKEGRLIIYNAQKQIISRHELCLDKGKVIVNRNHSRDKSEKIKDLMNQTAGEFTDSSMALKYFTELKKVKRRYMRDQLLLIGKIVKEQDQQSLDQALAFCYTHRIHSANDFAAVAQKLAARDRSDEPDMSPDWLLKDIDRSLYQIEPKKSDIQHYESIVKPAQKR